MTDEYSALDPLLDLVIDKAVAGLRSHVACIRSLDMLPFVTLLAVALMNDRMSDLGELEREVMQLVWSGGEVTAEAIREKLERKLKESTVRTVLRRLEDKGYVMHRVSGRTFVFRAVASRQDVAARAVKHIVDWFCNGSLEDVLVGMVDARMLDSRTLQQLAKRIDKAKGGK
jgi:BlaI family transcriptional regulator, penicillinase repressor